MSEQSYSVKNISTAPDGFYLITTTGEADPCLVKLYDHPDFGGVRHVAFGPWDGAALMPVTDLKSDSVLKSVAITTTEIGSAGKITGSPSEDLIEAFVSNLFEHRAISYGELESYRRGEDNPLIEACVRAFTATLEQSQRI